MTRCYTFVGPDGARGTCRFHAPRGRMAAAEFRRQVAEVVAKMRRLRLRDFARISRNEREARLP